MAKFQDLLADPRLKLTLAETIALENIRETDAVTLLTYAITYGFFGIDFTSGPEPALSNYYDKYYRIKQPENVANN